MKSGIRRLRIDTRQPERAQILDCEWIWRFAGRRAAFGTQRAKPLFPFGTGGRYRCGASVCNGRLMQLAVFLINLSEVNGRGRILSEAPGGANILLRDGVMAEMVLHPSKRIPIRG